MIKILFSPQDDKIHVFKQSRNFVLLLNRKQFWSFLVLFSFFDKNMFCFFLVRGSYKRRHLKTQNNCGEVIARD